jgi:hypothetical protein
MARDVAKIFKERRFLGLRIFLYAFPFAAIGFFCSYLGLHVIGTTIFVGSWAVCVFAFLVHFKKRDEGN